MSQLGPVLSRHPVDNRRRWVIVGQWAAVALIAAALLVFAILHPAFSGAAGRFIGLLLIGVTLGAVVAVVQAAKAVRGGRGESFEVRERGLAHMTRRARREWRWDEVRSVRRFRRPGWFTRNGWDARWVVGLADGAVVTVNGLAADAAVVGAALAAHRPEAFTALEMIRGWRWLRWILPLVLIGCGVGAVIVIGLIAGPDEVEIRDEWGGLSEVPRFGDSEIALMAIGLIVSVAGFIVALSYLIVGYRRRNRGR